MATLTYDFPAIFIPEGVKSPPVRKFTAGAGHTTTAIIKAADLVALSAGVIARVATNASVGIAGYAIFGELDTFGGGSTATPYDAQLFGATQVNTALFPADPGQVAVNPLQQIFLEISLSATTGWVSGGAQQSNIGTTGGVLLDAGTNIYVFDPTQSNKIMTIYSKPQGPTKGAVGDLGARVVVSFSAASLV